MIIRAIFWIALVAFLMPHEPDLGFGRPGEKANTGACAHKKDCAPDYLNDFRSLALRNLDQVRADLAANGHPL